MKKNKKNILIILLFSILIMVPSIYYGYYKGHDTDFHVANISSIVDMISIKDIFVERPLKYLANNFGYGTRFFYPPLPHLLASYIAKFLQIFNIKNILIGMRITQWLTIFLSGLSMYLLTKKIFKKDKVSNLCSIIYMIMPYHLSEIFIRDAFSEMFIPISIPLIILGLLYLVDNKYDKFLLFFVIGYTLAIYSHMAMSIYFTIIILFSFFIIYFKQVFTKKNIKYLLVASSLILLLTSSFWLPLLEIKLKGNYAVFVPYFMTGKGDLQYSAINILELINYLNPHNYDYIRFNIPLFVFIILIYSLVIVFKQKLIKNKLVQFLLLFTLIPCIMITKLFPWFCIPDFLQTLQFPWRLVIFICLGVSIIVGISLNKLEDNKHFNLIFVLLISISLFSSYYYTYHLNNSKVDINNIDYNNLALGNQKEYLPYNTINNIDYYNNRSNNINIINGKGKIKIINNDINDLTFEVSNSSNLDIELPRLYYMGYVLSKDNKNISLEIDSYGFIKASKLDDGRYTLLYKGTTIMHLSKYISFLTLICCLIIMKKRASKKTR